jgi:hypothetical protein
MTLLDAPTGISDGDEAQLLFEEAKHRRRRRWLISGITVGAAAVVLAVVLGFMLERGGGSTARTASPSGGLPSSGGHSISLSFRPVLCYAPPLALAGGQTASTGPLPACSPPSQLTASNLEVNVGTAQVTANPPPDTGFSTYPSTPPNRNDTGSTVLLPGDSSSGGTRYVLGPAALTQSSIASASSARESGVWVVDVRFTPQGAVQWDALVARQFHAMIGVVVNGKVISTPITLPGQSSFTSFNGRAQISGSFTGQQAQSLARGL